MTNKDLNTLMLCALRYTIPRHTYMVSMVCEIIEINNGELDNNTKNTMIRDLDEGLKDNYIHDCDRRALLHLLQELKND